MCNIETLRKNLQALANQVGSKRYEASKALVLQDLIITDMDGNVLDPSTIDYSVELMSSGATEDPAVELEASPVDDMKTIADEVAKAVKLELSNKAAEHPITTRKEITVDNKVYSRIKNFKNNDEAFRFGSWALGCIGYKKSAQWCVDNGIVTKAANIEGNNLAGGFLVPEEFENTIITLREQFGVIRNHARVVPMSSDIKRMPRRSTNLTASFVGEAGTATQTNETFDQINLVAKKSMVLTKFSSELSEDAVINFADDLAGEMAYAQAKLEDQCAFIGDSTSTYGGMTGLATAIGTAGVSTATNTTAQSISIAEIQAAFALLPQYADNANAKIFCHKTIWNSLFLRLAYFSGGNNAVDLLTGSGQLSFAGYPVVLTQAMNSSTATGKIMCHFGDMSQAVYFGDRRQTSVDFSNSALTSFETDMLCYRATTRWDLVCANVGDTSTVGSMITLKTG
ncbi:COG4653 Predicted phage phi-C31 gp36 major capsid-like protein [uncultured Caudovirales phage]|uniref:COG4653 Predicted phage phi-C31 gp36 major capsid-like protein n=1 Tax=uncultured Caudovirales phage TaxID=2100421 RepID=A0A6J7XGM6_9CAUD|nr:COG4653 Predicted phage phi-C31 gp36 major capsid-like protein [uncultured Caudovirales phage]CAB4203766.1 COG4653 Predicted phage phi-C31 gp36 major capsid-like protein [uncultured Caudovirales phage]CAB4215335.1 COG4653 Predicted phage phi-C31 gp36 major capsid-like protein [uncultured Caudovirales phage]CAB5230208.1 COG4653 Predicted phage phi-C31 gp36 major capsid-like protein [uncultured Caudovirales phage]